MGLPNRDEMEGKFDQAKGKTKEVVGRAINDRDLEAILEAAAANGAQSAGWVLLRLPLEVAPLFREWLDVHYPLRAAHVMSLVQQMRGGRDYDSKFGTRMRGTGEFATLIEQRFAVACRRLGLNRDLRGLDRIERLAQDAHV